MAKSWVRLHKCDYDNDYDYSMIVHKVITITCKMIMIAITIIGL